MNYIDLHQDIAGAQLDPLYRMQTDFAQLTATDAKIVFGTGFTLPEKKLSDIVVRDLAWYTTQCATDPRWCMVQSARDVHKIMTSDTARGILFHVEGLPGFAGDWDTLESWYVQGLRSVGLVWNDDNQLGGGTNSARGLTELGKEFIRWCEERQILIDLAHMNPVMFADSMRVVTRPPFISHGGLYSLVPNRRNYADEQLRAVTSLGGVFGVFLARSAMTTEGAFSVTTIARHLMAAVDLVGEDAVTLGTDFGGMSSGAPAGLESAAQIGALWEELRHLGCSDIVIEKIAYMNAQRYLLEHLPS